MAFVFIRTSSRHVLTLLMGTKMALKQSRQRQLLHRGGSGSYVAGCCVALGCPSWAMTSRLCMTHSQSQTCLVLSKPLGPDGPASVFQQLRRKTGNARTCVGWCLTICQHPFTQSRGLAVRSADLRAGGPQSLFNASAPRSGLLRPTQRTFLTNWKQFWDAL